MISAFALFLVAILNLLPDGITGFTLTMPENPPLQLVKQADEGWKASRVGEKESPVFYVKGTQLTAKGAGQDSTTDDLAEAFGATAATDWRSLKELRVYERAIGIKRLDDGVDFVIPVKRQDKEVEERVLVRWSAITH